MLGGFCLGEKVRNDYRFWQLRTRPKRYSWMQKIFSGPSRGSFSYSLPSSPYLHSHLDAGTLFLFVQNIRTRISYAAHCSPESKVAEKQKALRLPACPPHLNLNLVRTQRADIHEIRVAPVAGAVQALVRVMHGSHGQHGSEENGRKKASLIRPFAKIPQVC